jgi:hypothetical protein
MRNMPAECVLSLDSAELRGPGSIARLEFGTKWIPGKGAVFVESDNLAS